MLVDWSRFPYLHPNMRTMHTILCSHVPSLLRHPLFLFSFPLVASRFVNRTIDDEYGDSVTGAKPVYEPSSDPVSNWRQGATCKICSVIPNKDIDLSQAVERTWHDSTYHPGHLDHTINAPFTGTAVYVYFIVPNFVKKTKTFVNLSFSIDGTFYNQYQHIPDTTSTVLYHTLVFHTTNLVNAGHNVEIRASGSNVSILLFDNIIYTVEEADEISSPLASVSATALPTSTNSPNSSPSTPSTGPGEARESRSSPLIAGSVVGGVIVLSLLLVFYCYVRKRRHHSLVPSPFTKTAKERQVLADAFDPAPATVPRQLTHLAVVSAQPSALEECTRTYIHVNSHSHHCPHGPPSRPTQRLRSSLSPPPASSPR